MSRAGLQIDKVPRESLQVPLVISKHFLALQKELPKSEKRRYTSKTKTPFLHIFLKKLIALLVQPVLN